ARLRAPRTRRRRRAGRPGAHHRPGRRAPGAAGPVRGGARPREARPLQRRAERLSPPAVLPQVSRRSARFDAPTASARGQRPPPPTGAAATAGHRLESVALRQASMDRGMYRPLTTEGSAGEALRSHFDTVRGVRAWMNSRVRGQPLLVDRLLIGLVADGHLLVEGAPGLA